MYQKGFGFITPEDGSKDCFMHHRAPSTRVEWTLSTRDDGGTKVHLRESGFLTDRHRGQNTEGWDEELGELVTLLAP